MIHFDSRADLPPGETFTAPADQIRPGDYVGTVHGWYLIRRANGLHLTYANGYSVSGYPYSQSIHRPTTPVEVDYCPALVEYVKDRPVRCDRALSIDGHCARADFHAYVPVNR